MKHFNVRPYTLRNESPGEGKVKVLWSDGAKYTSHRSATQVRSKSAAQHTSCVHNIKYAKHRSDILGSTNLSQWYTYLNLIMANLSVLI